MKSKLAEFIKWYDTQKYAVDQAEMLVKARQLLAEEQSQKPEASAGLQSAIEELADIKATFAHIVNDECAKDEKHCSCVPALRMEIERLKSLIPAKEQSRYTKNELRAMLDDVVSVLELSDSAIEKHGPLGTPPAQLVKEVLDEKDMIIKMLKNGMKCIESNPAKEQEPLAVLAERKGYCKTTAFHTVVGTWWILLSDCYGKEWTSSPQSNPTNYTLQEAESKARKYLESIPDVDNGNNV